MESGDLLTVEEAADQLDRSVATVRRWSAQGRLVAHKVGKQWLVDRASLARIRPRRPVKAVGESRLVDLTTALTHVRSVDLTDRDLMVPDVLRFEDQLADPEQILQIAGQMLRGDVAFGAAIEVDLPKSPFFNRTAVLLSIEDRVAYQSVVSSFADSADSRLLPSIFGGRRSPEARYFLKDGIKQWLAWKDAVKAKLTAGYPWMIKTDITAYFDSMPHSSLIASVEALNPDPRLLDALRRMLKAWALAPSQGIPQGPNASRFLQNIYFLPIDQEMSGDGWRYFRYIDDIRIVARSRSEAMAGLRQLERLCRKRGLVLSAHKTKLVEGRRAIADWDDAELDKAEYFLAVHDQRDARYLLRSILNRAIKGRGDLGGRAARFSLWRLKTLRDPVPLNRVLAHLEDLGPLASVAANYLQPFIYRRHVQEKLEVFLLDKERNTSSFLATWLLAAILDCTGLNVDGFARYARRVCRNKNEPVYLRIMAANVLAKAKMPADLDWIREEMRTEFDPTMLRGYAVALARVSALDRGTSGRLTSRIPGMTRTLKYLSGRRELPRVLSDRGRVRTEPATTRIVKH